MSKYETVIGLEIHAQLNTVSKMFCGCDNFSFNLEPNTNVCPVCLGMPGTLPVANKKAVEYTYLLGMAIGGKIAEKFNFERKNYFYPDLPKAYQITSSTNPPVVGGHLDIEVLPSVIPGRKPGTQPLSGDEDEKIPGGTPGVTIQGGLKKIRFHHVHLEEDAGKLVHPSNADYSLVDLNRAGTPLMEMVTEPDLRSPLEAKIFMQDLRSILRYLGISDANMEQGNMRCDANVSLRPVGQEELGTKVEIKNMNSFRMIERALEYEVERQTEMLENGEKIVQETRGWNEAKGKTVSQRSKEEANDYRYFPEPDLPPIMPYNDGQIDLDEIRALLPELPKEKCVRIMAEYGLAKQDAETLTSDLELAKYFEKAIESLPNEAMGNTEVLKTATKKISNWIIVELLGRLNKSNIQLSDTKIEPSQIAELVNMIEEGQISGKVAKDVFDEMFELGKSPAEIVAEKGLGQVSDTGELEKIVDEVIVANQKSVEDYKSGKQQAFGFLIGQVMARTKGQANPKIVNEILKEKLS